MTPAIQFLKKKKTPFTVHPYEHDPAAESYGLEAALKLGVEPGRVYKTLVVQTEKNELVVSVLPVDKSLDLKLLAKTIGCKKVVMADKRLVQKTTGYVIGGVSPLGQKKRLRTVIDSSIHEFETIYISGGRRGLDIELSPVVLAELTGAAVEIVVE